MDRHTLLITQATLLIFLGIGVLLSRRTARWQSPDNSADWFSAGYILGGIGLGLQSFRGVIPALFSVVLGGFLFLMVMPCMNRAIAASTRQDARRTFRAMLGINAIAVAMLTYTSLVHPMPLVRSITLPVVLMVTVSINFVTLRRSKDEVIEPAVRVFCALMALHFLSSLVRIVMMLRTGTERYSIIGVVTVVGTAITFMWVDALRLRSELEQRAMLDPLTSLFNRRALDIVTARELTRATRKHQPCSALMLDIDQFKRINDEMGHAAGDATLCAVASALRSSLRDSDVATRLGGDEFFVLLPDADETAATGIVTRIRTAIESLAMKASGDRTFSVSVSIGQVTSWNATTVEDLLQSSDVMLYREKQTRYSTNVGRHVANHPAALSGHVQPTGAYVASAGLSNA